MSDGDQGPGARQPGEGPPERDIRTPDTAGSRDAPEGGTPAGSTGGDAAPALPPAAGSAPPAVQTPAVSARLPPGTPPPSPGSRVGLVILAAGPSTRMGTPKQLIAIEGKLLVVRAVEAALAAPVWPVVVVLGADAERIRPALARLPVLVTENPAWPEGMASSIRAGVTALQQFSRRLDAALIALCDQPAFSSDTIAQLIAAQRVSGRSIAAAHYAGRNGAPALFLREHFSTLTALTGEEGARALLNDDASRVTPVALPALALDLDTPADLAGYRSHSRASRS